MAEQSEYSYYTESDAKSIPFKSIANKSIARKSIDVTEQPQDNEGGESEYESFEEDMEEEQEQQQKVQEISLHKSQDKSSDSQGIKMGNNKDVMKIFTNRTAKSSQFKVDQRRPVVKIPAPN
jgi:hypothetical protein